MTLSRWSGWGALPEVFEPTPPQPWARATRAWLEANLGPAELRAARRSILNAHYTTPVLAEHMWQLAQAAGWAGGEVLEPGCGSGVFLATAPPEARVVGVELDPLTAALATALHEPDHVVINTGIEAFDP